MRLSRHRGLEVTSSRSLRRPRSRQEGALVAHGDAPPSPGGFLPASAANRFAPPTIGALEITCTSAFAVWKSTPPPIACLAEGQRRVTREVRDLIPILRVKTVDPQVRVRQPFVGTESEDRFDLRAHVFLRHLFEPTRDSPDVDDRGDLLEERLILRFEVSLVRKRDAPVFTSSSDLGCAPSAIRLSDVRQVTGHEPGAQFQSLMAPEEGAMRVRAER
jgi:hypothetical protein